MRAVNRRTALVPIVMAILLGPIFGGAIAHAQTPTQVARYAPRVWLTHEENNYPSGAIVGFISHASLRWSHDWACSDHSLAGMGNIVSASLGNGGYGHRPATRTLCSHYGDTYYTDDFTRPRDSGSDRGGLETSEGFFMDLDNDYRGGTTNLSAVPSYYQYSPYHYITYWFFYPYNDGYSNFNHEGDWERISVLLNSSNSAYAVKYFRHSCSSTALWADVYKVSGHPIAYSATGSHGSYSRPGSHDNCSVPGTTVRDSTDNDVAWDTWSYLAKATDQGWYGYGGAWGEVGEISTTTGPLGPSRYKNPS